MQDIVGWPIDRVTVGAAMSAEGGGGEEFAIGNTLAHSRTGHILLCVLVAEAVQLGVDGWYMA